MKDREAISNHAKEMWMQESTRAAKLADSLAQSEKKIDELEKNLSELSQMYNESCQELRQLKHLFNHRTDATSPSKRGMNMTPTPNNKSSGG